MKNYVLYDLTTGHIHQQFNALDQDEAIGFLDRLEGSIQGSTYGIAEVTEIIDDAVSYIVDDQEIAVYPPKPNDFAYWDWPTMAWVDPRTSNDLNESAWASVRAERDRRLTASDWVVTKSVELGEPVPTAWRTYRKALRDITLQLSPAAIEWPVMPPTGAPVTPPIAAPIEGENMTIEDKRAAKSAELLLWRADAERGGFDWNGQWFETGIKENVDYMVKLQDAIASAKIDLINHPNIPFIVRWPLINNGYVDLMREHLILVGVRMADNTARIYQKARNLQALINDADAATLATITWDSLPLPYTAE